MLGPDVPRGRPYDALYVDHGDPKRDSPRMRARLGAFIREIGDGGLIRLVELRFGTRPNVPYGSYDWQGYFAHLDINDMLVAVTLVHHNATKNDRSNARSGRRSENAKRWREFVKVVFHEENVHYFIDEEGGVHNALDGAMVREANAAIRVLSGEDRAHISEQYSSGVDSLASLPPNGRLAVRDVFEATESLFRQVFPEARQLNANALERYLKPEVQRLYDADEDLRGVALDAYASMVKWVDAAHPYRHGSGQKEMTQPPLEIATLLVSEGTGFIRWLAEVSAGIGERGAH